MILMRKPSGEQIRSFIEQQSLQPFSYPDLGATRGPAVAGYTVDSHQVQLGRGEMVYQRGRKALLRWRMFELPWVQLCWPTIAIEPGNTLAILVRVANMWWMNACRVVYTIEESGEIERVGFAYGTLTEHAERGEERFVVEWHHSDDTVWYKTLGYSQPNHRLARLGAPLARRTQQRFSAESQQAMARAVSGR